jgi:hypothetical protein
MDDQLTCCHTTDESTISAGSGSKHAKLTDGTAQVSIESPLPAPQLQGPALSPQRQHFEVSCPSSSQIAAEGHLVAGEQPDCSLRPNAAESPPAGNAHFGVQRQEMGSLGGGPEELEINPSGTQGPNLDETIKPPQDVGHRRGPLPVARPPFEPHAGANPNAGGYTHAGVPFTRTMSESQMLSERVADGGSAGEAGGFIDKGVLMGDGRDMVRGEQPARGAIEFSETQYPDLDDELDLGSQEELAGAGDALVGEGEGEGRIEDRQAPGGGMEFSETQYPDLDEEIDFDGGQEGSAQEGGGLTEGVQPVGGVVEISETQYPDLDQDADLAGGFSAQEAGNPGQAEGDSHSGGDGGECLETQYPDIEDEDILLLPVAQVEGGNAPPQGGADLDNRWQHSVCTSRHRFCQRVHHTLSEELV